MIKKLSASLFALALVVCALTPAHAQDVIGVYGDALLGGGLQRAINTPASGSFDIAVIMKADASSSAAEFVITELQELFPSIFKLSTKKVNNTQLDLGDNSKGEYLIAFATCVGVGQVEIVRVTYGDFGGAVTNDVVVQIRGFQPGDTRPSSFNGSPGYVDCQQVKLPLTAEPFPVAQLGIDPAKLASVDSSDGTCALNAQVIPNETTSFGAIKSRF